jgi:hypothetical protein
MQSINLLLNILWSPAEAMFLWSKNPRVLAPIVFLCVVSLLASSVVFMRVDVVDLAMRAIERTPQGVSLPDEVRESIRQSMSSPIFTAFQFASAAIGPIIASSSPPSTCLLVIGFGFLVRKGVSKVACAGAVVGVFFVYAALRLAIAAL